MALISGFVMEKSNANAVITVLGMIAGAAFCHNFGLASSAKGPTENGKIAVLVGFGVALAVSLIFTFVRKKEKADG